MKTLKSLLLAYSLLLIPFSYIHAQTGCISGDCENGIGTCMYYNGDKYVGEWYNNKYNGQGTYYYSDGAKYIGEWRNGQKFGKGTYYWANGDRFEGMWRNGKRNGRGVYSYAGGRYFSGLWADDVYIGKGLNSFGQKGCVTGDCGNGTGTCIYFNGDEYVGEWTDFRYNGQGIYYYANGDKYVGSYTNGKKNGNGTYYWANGRVCNGVWENGTLMSYSRGEIASGNSGGYQNQGGGGMVSGNGGQTQSNPNNQPVDTTHSAPPVITPIDKLNNDERNFETEVKEKQNGDSLGMENNHEFDTNNRLPGEQKIINDESSFDKAVMDKRKSDSVAKGEKPIGQSASSVPDANNYLGEWKDEIPLIKTTIDNSNSFAVIIGNRDYQYVSLDSFAINDAKAVRYFLINMLGYKPGNIYYQENASQSVFETYFGSKENPKGKLFNNIKPGISNVFVYYAGHGGQGQNDTNGYFVPVDCDPQYIAQGGYSRGLLYNNLSQLHAKNITVVTDACFSGAEMPDNTSSVNITKKNTISRDSNFVVFSSCSGAQRACWYNAKAHGMFTYFFLNALTDIQKSDENRDKHLTFKEIYDYVSDQTNGVPYYARSIHNVEQTPTIEGKGVNNVLVEYK